MNVFCLIAKLSQIKKLYTVHMYTVREREITILIGNL